MINDERVNARATDLLPEELAVGSDDPHAQAAALLGESDERRSGDSADPNIEHRTSDEAAVDGRS